MALLKGIKLVW
jgi:hypothetical protein